MPDHVMVTAEPISDAELDSIEQRAQAASPGPWVAYIEGRDQECGSDFIMIGGDERNEDMYLSRNEVRVSDADLDFVAGARHDVPRLVMEVRRLRAGSPPLLTDPEISEMWRRASCASAGRWEAFVDGRDTGGGNSFIRTENEFGDTDLKVTRDTSAASEADYDFIATARQDVPRLVDEVKRLRAQCAS